jgi:hypothetical protein
LKEKNFSPATTRTNNNPSLKKRCVQLAVTTCANGTLTSVVIKIKDAAFKEVQSFPVSK